MLNNLRIYDERGQLAVCHICGQPATTFVNIAVNCASGTPSVMKPVCDTHNPYKFTWNAGGVNAEVERLRTENAALREMLAEIVAAADATYVETHPYAGVGHTRVVGPFPEVLTKARAILAEQPNETPGNRE